MAGLVIAEVSFGWEDVGGLVDAGGVNTENRSDSVLTLFLKLILDTRYLPKVTREKESDKMHLRANKHGLCCP